ncbi:hypothetical protein IE81DRAFT_368487 [Ceraceosorus guamensis]|uniref:Uncharacterized protein n=1 Tax=Ceraceosorus guamensis TaxID=1522189 RepID=A0A316VRH0_9BASI|nr:hypothetical protein IE81DRAFT_368487 [Ceraceosorus guamensis]PWN40196.1 hypothetical protein IE81DRAFT_368487 [Ceraceosorus guamensis]
MFKRIAKLAKANERDEKLGIPVGEDFPPEARMGFSDDEDESDSESEDDSEDDESGHDTANEAEDGAEFVETAQNEEESSRDDDDEEVDEEEEEELDLEQAPMSIPQALESTIYVAFDAPLKKTFQIRSCVLCPDAQLKNDKDTQDHVSSQAHAKRLAKFEAYIGENLSEKERTAPPSEGGADPRHIVAEIAAASRRAEASRKKHKQAKPSSSKTSIKSDASPKKKDGMTKSERRRAYKAAQKAKKEEKRKARAGPQSQAALNTEANSSTLGNASAAKSPAARKATSRDEHGGVKKIDSGEVGISTTATKVSKKRKDQSAEPSHASKLSGAALEAASDKKAAKKAKRNSASDLRHP